MPKGIGRCPGSDALPNRAGVTQKEDSKRTMNRINLKWSLVIYDIVILLFVDLLLLGLYRSTEELSMQGVLLHGAISGVCIFTARFLGSIYRQIWRYGGIQCYIRLLFTDGLAFAVTLMVELTIPLFFAIEKITFARMLAVACMNLLCSMAIRMIYRYAYKFGTNRTAYGRFLNGLLRIFAGGKNVPSEKNDIQKIKIAIIGAGRVGVTLAEELMASPTASSVPRCFVDAAREKAGREIHGIPVLPESPETIRVLKHFEVQEVVFAIPHLSDERKKELYEVYSQAGYRIKVYDYPVMQTAGSRRYLREFDVEELLFRKPVVISDEKTGGYYRDKVILITGGGGSIGSELCRQLAKMNPRQIVLLDICENGVYEIQQEMKMIYGSGLDLAVEICSITNKRAMERVFDRYRPQIVINAAAHKHVPMMEHNCVEAVENNVFGTLNLVQLCEEYGAARFMMVSTDKAVNPVNMMGATKRMCEMIIQSASVWGRTTYSATRFGNVLGSAGSVIPLFRKQIANGGPITLTDKRIIRYFMTIPEASQLVLESGAMAKNGELFVLDMGQPVRILDLAENMIRISGVSGIEIVETGLRPGEKLYEELLIRTEELTRTENKLIYIEKDDPLPKEELDARLRKLKEACDTGDDELVRRVMKQVVPTYRAPEEVNPGAENTREMKACREAAAV